MKKKKRLGGTINTLRGDAFTRTRLMPACGSRGQLFVLEPNEEESTVQDTHLQDTLRKPTWKKEHTDTKEWGLRSVWDETLVAGPTLVDRNMRVIAGRGCWQAHLLPTTTCESSHEELWAMLQHANARAGPKTEFQHHLSGFHGPA